MSMIRTHAATAMAGLLISCGAALAESPSPAPPILGPRPARIDLRLVSLEVVPEAGKALVAGKKAWIRVTWARTGPEPARPFRLEISVDRVSLGATVVDHTTTGTTLSHPWTALAGSHTVAATIDSAGLYAEPDERNNSMKIRIEVAGGLMGPVR